MLRFEGVGKVFCETQRVSRRYAMRDILRPRRDRLAHQRTGEWIALRDISFELNAGETLLVLGMSGSGKSTIADLITGHRAPDVGKIVRRGSVGLLGGGKYGQNPYMKLREYVRLMSMLQGVQAADLDRTCETVLEWTGLAAHSTTMVTDLPQSLVSQLPVVGSMLVKHDIYVFDDYAPLGDSDLERRLAGRLQEICSTSACVMTSAGRNMPERVHQAVLLHGGEIIYTGAADDAQRVYEMFTRHARRMQQERTDDLRHHFRAVPAASEARALILNIGRSSDQTDSVLEREITLLRGLGQPIVVGPCLADPGWEALFWLPFVKWARRRLGSAPVLALSKGAVGPWYADAADRFVNVYDLVSIPEYNARDEERVRETGALKQTRISRFETDLVRQAAERCGLPATFVALHPSVMLALLTRIGRARSDISELTSSAIYERLPRLVEDVAGLPARYVVMSLRFTNQFPNTAENLAFASGVMRAVSARIPVVVPGPLQWSSPDELDGGCGVHAVDRAIKPSARRLLASIVGGAEAVIGTIMGPVTLAPFLGVPSLCVHAPAAGSLEYQLATMRHAADELKANVRMAAVDTITTDDVSRWLDEVLAARPSVRAGAGPV